jgi:hypothetical protein
MWGYINCRSVGRLERDLEFADQSRNKYLYTNAYNLRELCGRVRPLASELTLLHPEIARHLLRLYAYIVYVASASNRLGRVSKNLESVYIVVREIRRVFKYEDLLNPLATMLLRQRTMPRASI